VFNRIFGRKDKEGGDTPPPVDSRPAPEPFPPSVSCGAGCPRREGYRCSYRDATGRRCTYWCPDHSVYMNGRSWCQRHANSVKWLQARSGSIFEIQYTALSMTSPEKLRFRYRLDGFGSGDAGVVAWVEEGALRIVGPWPQGDAIGPEAIARPSADWPRVEILISHAGADGAIVSALVALGARGLVVAGTGNGTLHHTLHEALLAAQRVGVRVLRCTRCAEGAVVGQTEGALTSAGALSPVKARVELMLQLLAAQ